MALIMCFSLVFGAAAVTEGEQIMPSTSVVSPTEEEDFVDQIGGIAGDYLGTTFSQLGSDINEGIKEAHGFLAAVDKIINNIKIFFANLINTLFPFFGIGMGNPFFG